jgi:hypothetical protein
MAEAWAQNLHSGFPPPEPSSKMIQAGFMTIWTGCMSGLGFVGTSRLVEILLDIESGCCSGERKKKKVYSRPDYLQRSVRK